MKYMGSKARIAKYLVPYIQNCIDMNSIDTYVEPFMGGCNMLDKIQCIECIGMDKNKYLVALFQHLQAGEELLESVPKELYDDVRSTYQNSDCKYEDWLVGNVGFLASYNGRWFDGGYAKAGYEKTKNGQRYRDYYQEAKRNIETQIYYLGAVDFRVSDYIDYVPKGNEMIYCDPPYQNTKQYANAVMFDYDIFWETMRKWSVANFVLISEETAPDDFICVWEKAVSRSIKATDKSVSTEKLFTYKTGRYAEYLHSLG